MQYLFPLVDKWVDWYILFVQVKEVAPEARKRDAMLSFAFVYPDKNGKFVVREVSAFYFLEMWWANI